MQSMRTMKEPDYQQFVEAATTTLIDGLEAQVDQTKDQIHHLAWVLAIPIAGLGALLTWSAGREPLTNSELALRITAAASLLLSLITGGIVARRLNRALLCYRQEIGLALDQKVRLIGAPSDTELHALQLQMSTMNHAEWGGEKRVAKLREDAAANAEAGFLLRLVYVLVLFAYVILIGSALTR
jgi:hypothetical protein